MDDPLSNPPMPEWNDLANDERLAIGEQWEMHSCPHACGGSVIYVYDAIRTALFERARRVFRATMAGPSESKNAGGPS